MSRKSVETFVLDSSEILTDEEIRSESWNYTDLLGEIRREGAFQFLVKRKVLSNTVYCEAEGCDGRPMRLVKNKNRVDQFRWQCVLPCKRKKTVRSGSFLYGSHLKLGDIVLCLYNWANNNTLQADNSWETGIGTNTVSKWNKTFRLYAQRDLFLSSDRLGGLDAEGRPKIVEVDESLFTKRKYNRGRVREQRWVLGGIERGSNRVFMIPVADRRAETLLSVIREWVQPETRIVTDMWRSYNRLAGEYAEHSQVNHSLNFVSPEDPMVHTQNIENRWLHAKKKLRNQFGTSAENLEGYLAEYAWRSRIEDKRKVFNEILILLGRVEIVEESDEN